MNTMKTVLCVSLLAALTACGGAPKKIPQLEQAQADYQAASADEDVVRYAPGELDQAKVALDQAVLNWKKKRTKSTTIHHANVASKRIEIARLVADRNASEESLNSMDGERQQVQLDLRSKEITEKRLLLEQERVSATRARMEADALKREMAELKAKETERGMVLTLGDVLFDLNEATLKPGAERNIDKIADFMNKHPEKIVKIEGHTDSMGDDAYNLQLSNARADSVRQALVLRGVEAYRVSTQGFGETLPVASNDNRSGRQQNRRVEVIFPNGGSQVVENNLD